MEKEIMIKRYFSDNDFHRIEQDFSFLINIIQNSQGEYDLAIRNKYFNVYYKGNSLSKISLKKDQIYEIEIHSKFFDQTKAKDSSYYNSVKKRKENFVVNVSANQLHRFLQKKHLTEFSSRIKAVKYGEEIGFEQSLITDNLNREKLIFIDRQITDSKLFPKRLDLLALKQVKEGENQYQFLVAEVKLGNNSELKFKVADQLKTYVDHIKCNFDNYKKCYEKHYEQKKKFGLFQTPSFEHIKIVEPVNCIIIVGGYSGIAKKQIEDLNKTHPNFEVKHFTYVI
jgi:hypothetical protein